MAKSKADYYADGKADHENGNPRKTSFTKNSWQENAYDAGFNDAFRVTAQKQAALQIACDAEAARTARDDGGFGVFKSEAEAQADIAMREDRPVEHFSPSMNARHAHIANLRAQADKEPNAARQARLRGKANEVMARMARAA